MSTRSVVPAVSKVWGTRPARRGLLAPAPRRRVAPGGAAGPRAGLRLPAVYAVYALGAVGALACVAGCGDDLVAQPDAATPDPSGGGYQPERIGLINLLGGADSHVEAVLRDRPDPLPLALRGQVGDCRLYVRPGEAMCTSCDGVCVAVEECAPLPRPVSAGPITVTGLRRRLVFQPGPRGYEPAQEPSKDLFDVGAHIRVSASGDVLPAFTADLSGVPPLEVAFDRLVLQRGRGSRLSWTAAGVGQVALAVVTRRVGSPTFSSMLLCETKDYGVLNVAAELTDRLPGPRTDEEQLAVITRFQRAVVDSAGGPIEILAGVQLPVALERISIP